MTFEEYIEKFKKHYDCGKTCEDPDFLEYMKERYDEFTSYFPKVKLRVKTHKQWMGICEALRDIPESYGCGYGLWILINDKGRCSNGAYPIEWFEFID